MLKPISARAKRIRDVSKKVDAYRAGVRWVLIKVIGMVERVPKEETLMNPRMLTIGKKSLVKKKTKTI